MADLRGAQQEVADVRESVDGGISGGGGTGGTTGGGGITKCSSGGPVS